MQSGQTAKILLLAAGAVAAVWIYKEAPELEDEQRQDLLKASVGLLIGSAITYLVCKQTGLSICKQIGVG